MKYVLSMLLIVFSIAGFAAIYMQTNKNGTMVFSDMPLSNKAQAIEVPTTVNKVVTTVSKPKVASATGTTTAEEAQQTAMEASGTKNKEYTQFAFKTPKDQETLQNQPIIYVDMDLVPNLQKGDTIQIFLDGATWGAAAATTHFQFPKPDRGIHYLSAKLYDDKKNVLREAGPITVYIHYAHIPTSPPAGGNSI